MKILKVGDRGFQTWWVGAIVTCDCGRRVQLEVGDEMRAEVSVKPGRVEIDCQNCGDVTALNEVKL